jgi:glycosyltransferase involved in cell wall biosynthesis
VCVWMLQALCPDYDVTLLSWEPVALDRVNEYFGTSLDPRDFKTIVAAPRARAILRHQPLPLSSMKISVLRRYCKRIAHGFDLVVGAHNEQDFGRPSIQYIHHPVRRVRPLPVNLRWYHLPSAVGAYDALCSFISPFDDQSMRSNLTLVNSAWTGRLIRKVHGIDVRVVHPPAPGNFQPVDWARREDGFLCVGRLSPEKRLQDAMDILRRVRVRHPAAHLHIVGADDHPRYAASIREMARREGAWVTMEGTLSMAALASLLSRHRYFLHAMHDEHFGISVAQAVRAGCIPFVFDEGGQVEIPGDEPALRYSSIEDAAGKIAAVMADDDERAAIGERLRRRSEDFSSGRFMDDVRRAVAEMLAPSTAITATRRT